MPRLLLAALLALSLAACDDEPADPAQTEVVPEADVERFRAEVFEETLTIDADLARLEAEAAAADSVTQAAYTSVLDRLRDDRRRLQVRLDSLRPVPRASFDSTTAATIVQVERLRDAVHRAPFEAAPTYDALRATAGRALARLDARLGAVGPASRADTTGALQADLDSLAADRDRLAARIGAYPDTSSVEFPPFRTRITDAVLRLERRADEVVPDTSRTPGRPAPLL